MDAQLRESSSRMKRVRGACAFGAAASLVVLAACDTMYSTAGATNGDGDASSSDAGTQVKADGQTSSMGNDGGSTDQDGAGTVMSIDAAVTDSGRSPLGNVNCKTLGNQVLFCADFEGSFPYGFSSAQNSATITQTKGSPNGAVSNVLDMQLADGADAGSVVTQLVQPLTRPSLTSNLQLDVDVRVVSSGFAYASLAGFPDGPFALTGGSGIAIEKFPANTGYVPIGGYQSKAIATVDSAWHHVVVVIEANGDFSVAVDANSVLSVGNGAAPMDIDLAVGIFDVPSGATNGPTEVQIDNVVVRAF
jgi:hypothetical protein